MSAVLRVDLDAFAENLRRVRAQVAPAAHMLVVKDDAYNHGLAPIVARAWSEGVQWFGAFDVRTGLQVRAELGPEARIFVWIVATAEEAARAVAADLDIGVGDALLLEDVAAAGGRARVHLKIDSGLHRNGVRPEHWPDFVARAAALEADGILEVVGIWSHIAEASDAEDDAARAAFDAAVQTAQEAGLRPSLRHLSASAAAFARPEFRYDLARIGAFAYGIRPAGGPGEPELGVRPIAALTASVIRLDDEHAVIGIGALDGLPSTLAGLVDVRTPGGMRPLRALGLEQSIVDRWEDAAVGDVVTVYGEGAASATDLAERIGSIGEEIALRISPLVDRDYRSS
ncbi:alanine racemase [Microbacterium terricola]|uniref:Alanine racemase n=1 Tax=Microbacterium terricola TaxID=344163 RepID=A0ABM8DYN3_9MICO|nr:alanine racemase [Microbacterium terricola]UYK38657.1 alanine racemase [Microbacterium terricola]BDV30656.1 alanine racemase [Microbacterium terricola]